METLLLLIVIALLWIDVDEDDTCLDCRAFERGHHAPTPARRADFQLKQLTDQAVLAMLDEARRYEPGRRP